MNSALLIPILLISLGGLQWIIAGFVIWRRGLKDWTARLLAAYLLLTGGWEIALGIAHAGWIAPLTNAVMAWVSAYVIISLALIFLMLNRASWRTPGVGWPGWLVAAIGIAVVVVLQLGLLPVLATLSIGIPLLTLGAAGLAWAVLMGGAGYLTVRAYRTSTQPLHRDRIRYWAPVVLMLIAADVIFLLYGRDELSSLIRLPASLLAAYIVTAHRLPDVKQISRRLLTYLITSVFAIIFYVGSLMGLVYLFQTGLGYEPWIVLAITGGLLALIATPLVQLIYQLISQRIFGIGYDVSRAVSDYSTSIGNILDIARLTEKVTHLISETIDAREVRLFLVDHVRLEGGGAAYRLSAVTLEDQEPIPEGMLSATNPVATGLGLEGHPLAQYDIDFQPGYAKMPADERAWFAGLHMDVYVPIHARGNWIGLLTVGPKITRNRYFDTDMALLQTLADQTAVALENARLVADLLQLNKDLKQAYADLKKAHQQLNELDRLKSAFIGAITHELRTPVANIQFSIQLIEKYGLQHMLPEQQEQMYQLISATKYAKTMVDNLVNFATFIGKQGQLKLTEFNFADLLKETAIMLEPHARRKSIGLKTEAPPEGLPPLRGDRPRLGDAVYHLIQNAIKFNTPEGMVFIRCWVEKGDLFLEVKDTGVGVPTEKLANLWEGFSQMADPEKRGVEGLGLGLALVKYVIDGHDGEVYAESKQGEGSIFGFHIPLAGPKPRLALAPTELEHIPN